MSGYSDFSPYQPSPDEDRTARLQKEKHKQKQKNVKGKGKQSTPQTQSQYSSYQAGDDLPPEAYQQSSLLEEGLFSDAPSIGAAKGSQGGVRVNKYQTKVPIRVDIEAALTYVLGPITGMRKHNPGSDEILICSKYVLADLPIKSVPENINVIRCRCSLPNFGNSK